MKIRTAVVAAMFAVAASTRIATAQSATEHVAMGDRDHAAMNLASALRHYEAAIAAEPNNYAALCDASRDAVDLGEFNSSPEERTRLYASAQQYATRATRANPGDAEGHFLLARAIGRNALTMGTRDKIKYAGEVRDHAMEALKINPKHAGALHVMGVWNAEVMRLNGFSRMVAKNFLGGKVFAEASWDNAKGYLERAVAAEPNRSTHHLDLGRVYVDVGDKVRAKEQFDATIRVAGSDYNDKSYKSNAEEMLRKLR
ncbi:MAG: hypothetical protein JWO05_421 [Gemmatimonadetes bacterium]|nr:hypothetical protein [Gemmatimonadota bacterium]